MESSKSQAGPAPLRGPLVFQNLFFPPRSSVIVVTDRKAVARQKAQASTPETPPPHPATATPSPRPHPSSTGPATGWKKAYPQALPSSPSGPAAAVTGRSAQPSAEPQSSPSKATSSVNPSSASIAIGGKLVAQAHTVRKSCRP
jgi:hypothetical protein